MHTVIAVPSKNPGGLNAPTDAHFGHCDVYTVLTVANGQIGEVRLLPVVEHEHGGCASIVDYLAGEGITTMLAGGMGLTPLTAFTQKGIKVFHAANFPSVEAAVNAFVAGRLTPFAQEHLCQGGCSH